MTQSEIDKINRFTDRVPEHLQNHWIEIIDILEQSTDDKHISQLEMDNFEMMCKFRNVVKYILIMELWIKEKKINSLTGFSNMIHFIKNKAIHNA